MIRRPLDSGWRLATLAAALFAITLNFLQPLAHAALMRDGGPQAAALMWGAFCQSTTDQDDGQSPVPATGKMHECCLGLAHAPVLAELFFSFVPIDPTSFTTRGVAVVDSISPVGIRDGPSQPRAPPAFV